jgi:hypothetical protein
MCVCIYIMERVQSLLYVTTYEQECLIELRTRLLAAAVSVQVHSHVLEHDVNEATVFSS